MMKLIYLARRKPVFSFDQFVCRWRQHAALAMSQTFWRNSLSYVQAEPLRPTPMKGASDAYDAIATYSVRDGFFSDMTQEDGLGAQRMAEDELETFSGPIPESALWVQEEKIKPGEPGGIAAYLFFEDAVIARRIAEKAAPVDAATRVILNTRDDKAQGPGANTLPFSSVVEISAPAVALLAGVIDQAGGGLLHDADLAVVTREAVLWHRPMTE